MESGHQDNGEPGPKRPAFRVRRRRPLGTEAGGYGGENPLISEPEEGRRRTTGREKTCKNRRIC